ncbi:hypothetical protein TNCV_4923421 [Trichonephila clavipes]|nr:hypothetical protein TNCV_4923421 [Trichonephila clavipes]
MWASNLEFIGLLLCITVKNLVSCPNSLFGYNTNQAKKHVMDRISIRSSNLVPHEREPSLDHLVIGDEKWVKYKHMTVKKHMFTREDTTVYIQRWNASEEGYVDFVGETSRV